MKIVQQRGFESPGAEVAEYMNIKLKNWNWKKWNWIENCPTKALWVTGSWGVAEFSGAELEKFPYIEFCYNVIAHFECYIECCYDVIAHLQHLQSWSAG